MRWSVIAQDLRAGLETQKSKRLYRSPEVFFSKTSPKKLGRLVDFASNDYLGLSQHPALARAASDAARRWGSGSAASRLLSGNLGIHEELEKKLARFKREEAATVFSSGYLANLGVLQALANEKDLVVLDRFCHASLVDGARLSRAKLWVYPHRDAARLSELLSRAGSFRRRLVVTDAYFSMDGDLAPLPELSRVCRNHDAMLMIDEAHSTGVYGRAGGGIGEHFGVSGAADIVMGTLSKALGSVGGFIAGSRLVRETLLNFCRTFIYTTAPAPSASAAALRALRLIEKIPALRQRLWRNTGAVRHGLEELGLDLMGSEGPIIPIRAGSSERALKIQEKLKRAGFFVPAIRPPSVPSGTDRLRLSVSTAHTSAQIDGLLSAMKKHARGLR